MKYLVTIDYNHKKGFEMSEDMVVVAPDQEGAISYLSGLLSSRASVKSIARTRAISIEPIESPAPTDWGKEAERIYKMRDSVVAYLKENAPSEHCEFLCETQPTASLIEMAAYIQTQNAIAGGQGH